MAHQCVHCGKILMKANNELLEGCSSCGGKFFFYIRDENISRIQEKKEEIAVENFSEGEKKKIEEDVRDILKIEDEDSPVILDIESIKILGPGKFEIDIVSLMNRKPIVIKLQEGKYIIDLDILKSKKLSEK